MVFLKCTCKLHSRRSKVFSLKSFGPFANFANCRFHFPHNSIFVYASNHLDHRSDSPDAQDQVCVWVPRQVCALETIRPQTPCACVYKFHSGQENSSTNTKHLRHRANFYTLIQIICIGSGIQRICCVPNSIYLRSDRSLSSMKVDQCNTGHFKSSHHTNTVEMHSLTNTVDTHSLTNTVELHSLTNTVEIQCLASRLTAMPWENGRKYSLFTK